MLKEFRLSEKEYEQGTKIFLEKHKNCSLETYLQRKNTWWRKLLRIPVRGPYPAKYTYMFTPTGIGIGVKVRCNYCGEIKDITDYELW